MGNKSVSRHRIVCEMFVVRKEQNQIFVNHITGDRSDNSRNNLEWISREDNNIKAHGKACEVLNVKTKKVTVFESLLKCSKQYRVSLYMLKKCLKNSTEFSPDLIIKSLSSK